jgi:subtilisin family serine protease
MVVARVGSQTALASILRSTRVRAIYEERFYEPYLAQSLPLIGQPQVAASGKTGSGATVAVLDSGVEYGRLDFGPCSSPGVPASCRVVAAADFASPPFVDHSHGTNVAATVLGVAPGARIAALNVFSSTGRSSLFALVGAFNWCIANRPVFNIVSINLSLGQDDIYSEPCDGSPLAIPVSDARDVGIVTVAAAGNAGRPFQIGDPACAPKVISVGAVYDSNFGPFDGSVLPVPCSDQTTRADQVTCFSDSASILTMLAPGAWITAGGYSFAGTSQAAPHVAGAIAVLRAAYPSDSIPQTLERLVGNAVQVVDAGNGLPKPRLSLLGAVGPPSWGCSAHAIAVPGSATGVLRSNACHDLGTFSVWYADVYRFVGSSGQIVTIDLQSSLFNTYLFLRSPNGTVVAQNDDIALGSNTNSRINFTLTQTGDWDIIVESAFPYVTGAYSLSVMPAVVGPCFRCPRVVPFR